jgi:hypothetical protein
MNTYLIMRKGYAARYDWIGGFLGTVMDWSKQRAIKKAAARFRVPADQLEAFYQRAD